MWKHFYCKLIIWYWFLSDELIRFLLVFLNNNTALSCMKVVKMKSGVPMDFLPPSYWASHSVLKKHKKHERSCWGLSSSIASPPSPCPQCRMYPNMRCALVVQSQSSKVFLPPIQLTSRRLHSGSQVIFYFFIFLCLYLMFLEIQPFFATEFPITFNWLPFPHDFSIFCLYFLVIFS